MIILANKEILGVNAVERLISRTDYLEPFLNKNDKEPSWDGYINAYHHAGNHPKSDLAGRVAVQVKGHGCSSIEKERKSFSVDMADLKNYLQEGGTIFFVVYITDESEIVFYCNLLPYDLRKIIKNHGDQKSYTIQLKEFPTSKKKIADLVLNFIRNRDMQRTAISSELATVEELQERGMLQTLSFGYTTVDRSYKHPFDYLFDHDLYLYADLPFGISMPVEHIAHMEMAVAEIHDSVSVAGKVYYDSFKHVRKKDVDEFHFGNSIKLINPTQQKIGRWTYTLSGKLSERIRDEEFMISAIQAGGATFGEIFLPVFTCKEEEVLQFNIPMRVENLEFLKRAKATLDLMHVTVDLDCDNMQPHDIVNLEKLISGILDKNLVSVKDTGSIIGNYKIANLTLLVCCIKDEESGLFRLYDFFNAPLVFKGVNENGQEFDSSIHVKLDREALHLYNNLDYTVIARQIAEVPYSEAYSNQLTLFLLEILKAYDDLKLPTHPLLQLAKDVMKVIKSGGLQTEQVVTELNEMQILKRSGEFNASHVARLYEMSSMPSIKVNASIMTGIYLLMDNQKQAKYYYEQMSLSEKEQFDEYPICLYKKWEENS